jgi:hypothetical protein
MAFLIDVDVCKEFGVMEVQIGRYRLAIAIRRRDDGVCPCHIMDGERTDRDLAVLAQAELAYRDDAWTRRTILGSD